MLTGQTVPLLTAVGNGFVSPDTLASLDTAAILTTTATDSSAVGTYPIVVSAAADADYEISYVDGIMTVTAGGRHDDASSGSGKKCGMGSGFGAAVLAFMLAFRLALTRRRARFPSSVISRTTISDHSTLYEDQCILLPSCPLSARRLPLGRVGAAAPS